MTTSNIHPFEPEAASIQTLTPCSLVTTMSDSRVMLVNDKARSY